MRLPSLGFWRFTLKRLAALALLAVGITIVAFVLTRVVGDPTAVALGTRAMADPEIVATYRTRVGLDRPLPVQYLSYLNDLLHGDLGESAITRRPVSRDLTEAVPATIELATAATIFSVIIGTALGLVAALHHNRWLDQFLRVISLGGVSMPVFWLAVVAFYIFFFKLGLTPGGGRLDPGMATPPRVTGLFTIDSLLGGQWDVWRSAIAHLVLPALVLATYHVAFLIRFVRSAVLDVINSDFVRAAHAKGLPGHVVLLRHILRAASAPIVTMFGLAFGSLLSGAVLVEAIFSWPGLGQYAFRSSTSLDLPAIMGVSLFVAVAYITINFVVDLLYGVIDPRIRIT